MHILTGGTISQNRFLYLEINVLLASTPSAVYLVCTRVNNILERKAREIAAKCYDEYVHSKNSPHLILLYSVLKHCGTMV